MGQSAPVSQIVSPKPSNTKTQACARISAPISFQTVRHRRRGANLPTKAQPCESTQVVSQKQLTSQPKQWHSVRFLQGRASRLNIGSGVNSVLRLAVDANSKARWPFLLTQESRRRVSILRRFHHELFRKIGTKMAWVGSLSIHSSSLHHVNRRYSRQSFIRHCMERRQRQYSQCQNHLADRSRPCIQKPRKFFVASFSRCIQRRYAVGSDN